MRRAASVSRLWRVPYCPCRKEPKTRSGGRPPVRLRPAARALLTGGPPPENPLIAGGPIYGGRVCDPSGARGLRMRFSIGAAQPLPLLQHLSWMQDTSRAWVGGVLQRGCLAPALGGPTHFLYSGVSTKRLRCKTPPPRRRWWASALLSSAPTGGSPIGLPASRPHAPEGSALAFRKLVPCKNGDS